MSPTKAATYNCIYKVRQSRGVCPRPWPLSASAFPSLSVGAHRKGPRAREMATRRATEVRGCEKSPLREIKLRQKVPIVSGLRWSPEGAKKRRRAFPGATEIWICPYLSKLSCCLVYRVRRKGGPQVEPICPIYFRSWAIALFSLLAFWGNENGPPSMKMKKLKIFWNKMG